MLSETICSCGKEKAFDEELCPECQEKIKENPMVEQNVEQNLEIVKEQPKDGTLPVVTTPAAMIQMAIEGGADLDKLEKLLTLQERWEANEARKAYHAAMAQFKANPPRIGKDKTVAYGNTKYNHASLGNVTEMINQELSKYGLSASWTTQQNGAVSVTCRITHLKGHSEETTLTAPADSSGSKNTIQAIGSTITYLERYTLLALTGLATYDQDDDGIASEKPSEFITLEEKNKLADMLISSALNQAKFFTFMGVDAFDKIPKDQYQKALNAIKTVKANKEAKKEAKNGNS